VTDVRFLLLRAQYEALWTLQLLAEAAHENALPHCPGCGRELALFVGLLNWQPAFTCETCQQLVTTHMPLEQALRWAINVKLRDVN
jgi:hypothetical protein